MNILVSSCLLGENCKYNGGNNKNDELYRLLEGHNTISVCPEVLGGLEVPRPPAEILDGKVITKDGVDITEYFLKGANETLKIAKKHMCVAAILKSNSPSCGFGTVYDGRFTGNTVNGDGYAAEALKAEGIYIFTENDIGGSLNRFLSMWPIYALPADEAAPALLGKLLCCKTETHIRKVRITETEAYCGEDDTACHARRGKTKRCEVLYEEGGMAYVYLCYGIHSLLNVVTQPRGTPHAVLIRGVEDCIGPGRLTKELGINMSFNRENLVTSDRLWIENDGISLPYKTSPRVGIDYASPKYRDIHWRFIAV